MIETEPSLAERFARFITDPVSSLLIIAGVLILIADLFVEGFGIGGVAGLGLLALFFWGHSLAGLAGWEDLALVVLGLVLIAIEIIVVPGFGIPGVLGLAALLGGLFLAMLGREIQTPEGIAQAGSTILASLIGIVIGIVAIFAFLSRGRRLGKLVLHSAVGGTEITPIGPPLAGWDGSAPHHASHGKPNPAFQRVRTWRGPDNRLPAGESIEGTNDEGYRTRGETSRDLRTLRLPLGR